MSTFVLIHGAWMDARAWEKIIPRLEQAGHIAIAPDLPGHGADMTPIAEITLQTYTEHVCAVIAAQPEPVTLVGHSMAGTVISQVAEQLPQQIAKLVYLSVFLLRDGESLFQIGGADADSLLGPALIPDQEHGIVHVRGDAVRAIFFTDCSDADAARFAAQIAPEPLVPLATPIAVTQARAGRVPRMYIETLLDRAVSPAAQQRMIAASPCRAVWSLQAGHASFLSQPAYLAALLMSP